MRFSTALLFFVYATSSTFASVVGRNETFGNTTTPAAPSAENPILTLEYAQHVFGVLGNIDTIHTFRDYLDPNINWTITNEDPDFMSTPISGTWHPRDAYLGVLSTINSFVDPPNSETLVLLHPVAVTNNIAYGELQARASDGVTEIKALNGVRFDNRFCWILEFDLNTGLVATARAYFDTWLVNKAMNIIPADCSWQDNESCWSAEARAAQLKTPN